MDNFIRDEAGLYHTPPEGLESGQIIKAAYRIVNNRYRRGRILRRPKEAKDLFRVRLAERKQEVFACLFLDNRLRVIAYEELFFGNVNATSVHPREVARRVLELNAAAVIFGHNHPSGMPEPSNEDKAVLHRLQEALKLIETRVLDNLVVGTEGVVSFSERDLM